MVNSSPMAVSKILMDEIGHKNPKMREDIILYQISALLTFPSNDFNLDEILKKMVE